jgi:hypothetical protein
MGKKCPPQAFVGILVGKFFHRGDEDGEPKPDGEFPVAIPRHVLYIAGSLGRALEFPIHVSLYSTDDTCRGEFRYA